MHVLWCTFQYSSSNKKGVLIKHDANKSVAIFLVLLLINWICENKKDHNHKKVISFKYFDKPNTDCLLKKKSMKTAFPRNWKYNLEK